MISSKINESAGFFNSEIRFAFSVLLSSFFLISKLCRNFAEMERETLANEMLMAPEQRFKELEKYVGLF